MAVSVSSGPIVVLGNLPYNPVLGGVSPDFNQDAGPGVTYQGDSLPDVRVFTSGDAIQGRTGVVQAQLNLSYLQSVDQIPAAYGAANLAALQHTTNGTALTLVSTASVGVALNIPYMPFTGALNGGTTIPPLMLDFGFAWGNVTSANTTVTVAASSQFWTGMPLVIAGVGNSGGTVPLLTWVTGTPTATTITINDAPLATNSSTPIGTGNIWTPREGLNTAYPTAHTPYLAGGPALLLDPSQSIARGVSVTCSNASGTGGNVVVVGLDIYGYTTTETIAIAPGSSLVAYGKKAFKAIYNATPNFTDGTYNYSLGTSDVFGFHQRSDKWEYSQIFWNGAYMTASQGWLAGNQTTPATSSTGDVRGTVQASAIGGTSGGGIGTNSSNGTVSSLAMSGRRLAIFQSMPLLQILRGSPQSPQFMFGVTPA